MSEQNPVFKYSIESSGDEHILYWGRDHQMHGWNLCRISEVSHNCDLSILLSILENTLNEGLEANGLRKRIKELEAALGEWHYNAYQLESHIRFANEENFPQYELHPLLRKGEQDG